MEVELTELRDVQIMLFAAPLAWDGDLGLSLRDFIVESSRWVFGTKNTSTVNHCKSDDMPHSFFSRKGPVLGIKPREA